MRFDAAQIAGLLRDGLRRARLLSRAWPDVHVDECPDRGVTAQFHVHGRELSGRTVVNIPAGSPLLLSHDEAGVAARLLDQSLGLPQQ